NQFDASATPMTDCFTDTPDCGPFTALPSNVPLDQRNPKPTAIGDPQLRADALASAAIDFSVVDRAPEDLLNRILWRAMRGTAAIWSSFKPGITGATATPTVTPASASVRIARSRRAGEPANGSMRRASCSSANGTLTVTQAPASRASRASSSASRSTRAPLVI